MKRFKKTKIVLIVLLVIILGIAGTQIAGYLKWENMNTDERFESVLNRSIKNKNILGTLVKIETADNTLTYVGEKGNLKADDVFCIASTTKMFTAAVFFQLIDEGVIEYTDTLDKFLTPEELDGLHYYNGVNYGHSITIEQLISQTSGLPDHYLEEVNGKSLFDEILEKDSAFTFEFYLERTKALSPHFINGTKGKAHYADINYDILGEIAQRLTSKSLEEIFQERIYTTLGLTNTILATPESEYEPLYYKGKVLDVPLAKASMGANGGLISTLDDLMVFLRAFKEGNLFDISHIERGEWNDVEFDYHKYRNGMMRFQLTGIWAIFGSYELIGHSGSTGAFAFYSPEKEAFIVGTTNQATDAAATYRVIIQFLDCV